MKLEELYTIALQADSKEHFLKTIAIINGLNPNKPENIEKIRNLIIIKQKDIKL